MCAWERPRAAKRAIADEISLPIGRLSNDDRRFIDALVARTLSRPEVIAAVRAFEAAFEIGAKPVDENVVEAVLSLRIDDLEPRLTRSGYDVRSLAEQFDAKPAEIRRLLRGDLDPSRSRELMDEMRAAGLPT
jgi:hypothetical protein